MPLLYSPLLLLFLFLSPTFVFVSCGCWSRYQALGFCRYLSAAMMLLLTSCWWFDIFPREKLHMFSHHTIVASFVYCHFRDKNKAKQARSVLKVVWCWFCLPGGGNRTFSLTLTSPAAQQGAVYTHYFFGLFSPCACLTWVVRLCVCVCVCAL